MLRYRAIPLIAGVIFCTFSATVFAQPSTLVVSRVQYAGNTFGDVTSFPFIYFTDSGITGIQGNIFLDRYVANPGFPLIGTLPLTGITTSFSSKSEAALMLSVNGQYLTYMDPYARGLQPWSRSEGSGSPSSSGAWL